MKKGLHIISPMYVLLHVSEFKQYLCHLNTNVCEEKNKNQFSAQDGFMLSPSGYFFPSVLNFVWIHSVCNYCLCVENLKKKSPRRNSMCKLKTAQEFRKIFPLPWLDLLYLKKGIDLRLQVEMTVSFFSNELVLKNQNQNNNSNGTGLISDVEKKPQ